MELSNQFKFCLPRFIAGYYNANVEIIGEDLVAVHGAHALIFLDLLLILCSGMKVCTVSLYLLLYN